MKELDIIIIGGGTAGIAAAQSAVELGGRVGLVESNRPGGHSLFKGQLPLQIVRERVAESNEPISIEKLIQEVEAKSEAISKEIEERLKDSGVEYIKGDGALAGNHQVMVRQGEESTLFKSGKIIVATGSSPKPAPKIPFDNQSILHSDQLLEWKDSFASLLIVGGNKSALEAACLFNLLGKKVFLVDENNRLIHDKDPDLITAIEANFKKRKIKALLGKRVISMFKDDGNIDITLDGGVKFSTEKVLVAGERLGNTTNIGLDDLDIERGSSREIWVNEQLETSLKGVFAAGSVTGRTRSLQISAEEGRVAGINTAGGSETLDPDQIPFYLQTQPEVVSIGCMKGNAHYKGYRAVEGRYDFPGTDGSAGHDCFCRIIADRDSKRFIGIQVFGVLASESLAQLQSNIREGVPVKNLAESDDSTPSLKPIISAARNCVRALSARR